MSDFENSTILITGGGTGMGLATARLLLADGARVVITGRRADRLDAAVKELDGGDRVLAVAADVARTEDVDRLVHAAGERFGALHGVFANAGVGHFGPSAATTADDVDAVLATNVKGVYLTVQRALPLLADGSAIVLNASWTVRLGMPVATLYSASKAAVQNLAHTFGAELAGRGIRVNSVSPGFIVTDMFDAVITTEAEREATRSRVPIGRLGRPEDVAEAVRFLLSSRSSYITGQDLLVDGGLVSFAPGV